MSKHIVTLVYTMYAHYEFEAPTQEEAEAMAWADFDKNQPELTYGDWECVDIQTIEGE